MNEQELLNEIVKDMVEFTTEKKPSNSFSGQSVCIRFEDPNSKVGGTILDKFEIQKVAEKIIDIGFEFNLILKTDKALFEAYYGRGVMMNCLYQHTYFEGKDFIDKIKVLLDTTQLSIKQATQSVLEIYYTETLTKAIDFLKNLKEKVEASETHTQQKFEYK